MVARHTTPQPGAQNMLTADTISTDTIRALKLEARTANDIDTYTTCARALDKSIPTAEMMRNRQRCADIVNDARAMDDSEG
jgi:hypothetical protein